MWFEPRAAGCEVWIFEATLCFSYNPPQPPFLITWRKGYSSLNYHNYRIDVQGPPFLRKWSSLLRPWWTITLLFLFRQTPIIYSLTLDTLERQLKFCLFFYYTKPCKQATPLLYFILVTSGSIVPNNQSKIIVSQLDRLGIRNFIHGAVTTWAIDLRLQKQKLCREKLC